MQNNKKAHIYASIGTILLLLLLFLLLWFVYLDFTIPEEDEGIEVAFGVVEDAGGYQAEQSEAVPIPSQAAPSAPSAPSNQDLMTQEDEESLALKRQREKEEKARKEAEAERLRQQREAQALAEAEAKAKAEEEARIKAEQDAKVAKAAAMGSLFGNTGNTTGSGDGSGSGQKGNPVGHGSMGGSSWSLAGRSAKAVPKPGNNFTQEGVVVVKIEVNAEGMVVSASLGVGSTISDKATQQLAIDAAKKAQFSKGDQPKQVGTITYHFKFN